MYKIYINDTPILLTNAVYGKQQKRDKHHLVDKFRHRKSLFQYVDTLEKNHQFESIVIYSDDVEQLKDDFFSIFKIVPAAGGAVFNANNQLLMMFRKGSWDLPKGKIDEGESIEAAAVREVQEEVGLLDVEITAILPTTYHTYRSKKGNRILKPTYWFKMKTNETEVTLQTEEDIEKSEWTTAAEFLNSNKVAYGSINDVLRNL